MFACFRYVSLWVTHRSFLCPQTAIAHSYSKNECNDQFPHYQTNMALHPNLAFRNICFVLLHSNNSEFVNPQSFSSNQKHPEISRIFPVIKSSDNVLCSLVLLNVFCLCVLTGYCEHIIVFLFPHDLELSILANLTMRQLSVLTWMPKITKHLSFLGGLCHILSSTPSA